MTKKCNDIIGCSRYTSELNCSIISKRQFLSCASIAISERNDVLEQQKLKLNSPDCIHFDHTPSSNRNLHERPVQQFQL